MKWLFLLLLPFWHLWLGSFQFPSNFYLFSWALLEFMHVQDIADVSIASCRVVFLRKEERGEVGRWKGREAKTSKRLTGTRLRIFSLQIVSHSTMTCSNGTIWLALHGYSVIQSERKFALKICFIFSVLRILILFRLQWTATKMVIMCWMWEFSISCVVA